MDKTTLLIYESLCLLRYSRSFLHEDIMQITLPNKEDKWQWLQSMDHTIEKLERFMKEKKDAEGNNTTSGARASTPSNVHGDIAGADGNQLSVATLHTGRNS